jgi:hypothetical protein
MGFRCSLLGHTFTESDVNRTREVTGDEVVTIVETMERCSRCGAERVVAENKEVVSVVNAADVELDEAELATVAEGETPSPGASSADPGAEPAPEAGPDAPTADPEIPAEPDVEPETNDAEDAEDADTVSEEAPSEPPDPSEEDAELITETDGSLGGGDDVDVDPADVPSGGIGGMATRSGAYGDADTDGDGAEDPTDGVPSEDAEILGDGEKGPRDRAPGQWPDDPDAGAEPWEPGPLDRSSPDDPAPEEADSPPAEPAPDVAPTTETKGTPDRLRCPGCGHTVDTTSSFRAGDACPECRADYLEPPAQ